MWKMGLVGLLCLGFAGEVVAAPKKKTSSSKKKVQKKGKRAFRLPYIPMLQMRKGSRTSSLRIFHRDAIRGMKARKNRVRSKVNTRTKRRIPTRPPEPVQRIPLVAPQVQGTRVPILQTKGRQAVKVKAFASSKGNGWTQLTVHQHSLNRRGALRRWRGHILFQQGNIRYRCPLRSFCRTLRFQVQRLLRNGLRYKGKSISPRDKQFQWALRRALERKHGYAVVSKPFGESKVKSGKSK